MESANLDLLYLLFLLLLVPISWYIWRMKERNKINSFLPTSMKNESNKVHSFPFVSITPGSDLSKSSLNHFDWSAIKINTQTAKEALLGKGGFASVYRGLLIQKSGQFDVAIKIFSQTDDQNYDDLYKKAKEEAEIIDRITSKVLNKELIVSLYGVVSGALTEEIARFIRLPADGDNCVGLVMRLEAGGDLDSLLHPKANSLSNYFDLEFKLKLIKNIVNGLRELHAFNFVHGDLKPQNILLCDRKSSNIRLSDLDYLIWPLRKTQMGALLIEILKQ